MARDDTDDYRTDDGPDQPPDDDALVDGDDGVRTAAAEEVDQRIVDLLSWILDTETRAKIYVYLLDNPGSTSEEVATGTGLYPSTVREALAELHDEDRVTREKRASEGAGNNPYEYTAIQPSELVGGVVDQVQQELNTIFTLDRVLDREAEAEPELGADVEPVTITVDEIDVLEAADRADEAESKMNESTGDSVADESTTNLSDTADKDDEADA
ncbi:helix-turn-helix domain-containing protein [Natrarchaeobaculum sulfurireducens]|uniref:Putative transcriptional regulator n=1 Tax=Natrarchaeobaculum sulfurireducens TaxID=2044521 RepID=A0A346PRQ4_9EURY|nr:helix-turn-helix domain-containing protein [Natrarchaeobaculum sulfurireducens]AXR82199.1 putative transcriptional regulator [Natrarchaeobaculum sulfurireducens]